MIAAVDLPLHGITDTASPLYQAANEQTFNLDLVVNTTGAAGPDGAIDFTGTHFINLTYPLASRDNLRQGVVNLLALTRALPGLDLDGDAVGDIDATRIAFVGQSLGSIVGISFGAALPTPTTLPYPTATPLRVPTMVLSVPGGGVAALLRDSPTFGPRINAGLAQLGLMPGTSLYAQFFRDVQNIVDAGDPLNFVTTAAAQRSIYFQQMVGGNGTTVLPDQVIPNSATQRLIDAIIASGQAFPRVVPGGPVNGDGYVNFVARRSWFAAESGGQRPGHGRDADRDRDIHGRRSRTHTAGHDRPGRPHASPGSALNCASFESWGRSGSDRPFFIPGAF